MEWRSGTRVEDGALLLGAGAHRGRGLDIGLLASLRGGWVCVWGVGMESWRVGFDVRRGRLNVERVGKERPSKSSSSIESFITCSRYICIIVAARYADSDATLQVMVMPLQAMIRDGLASSGQVARKFLGRLGSSEKFWGRYFGLGIPETFSAVDSEKGNF